LKRVVPINGVIVLGGLVVIVVAIGPRFVGSNPAEDDEFLREIRIISTNFFGG
jgi:hypothetical protein